MTISFPPGDYVSPGLNRLDVDFAFPNLIVGDPATHLGDLPGNLQHFRLLL